MLLLKKNGDCDCVSFVLPQKQTYHPPVRLNVVQAVSCTVLLLLTSYMYMDIVNVRHIFSYKFVMLLTESSFLLNPAVCLLPEA